MKKFILMDPEEVKALKTQGGGDLNKKEYKIVNPQLNAMERLDRQMVEKLQDSTETDDEKAKSYVEAFQDFLTFKNQYIQGISRKVANEQPPSTVWPHGKGISTSDIAKSVPKHLRTKAERLAEMLKEKGTVTWDERNRLIVDGKPVEGTNIIDLINDALRRRKTFKPEGRSHFAHQLRRLNAPRELVGNEDYWKGSDDGDASGEDDPLKTPLRRPVAPLKRLHSDKLSARRDEAKARLSERRKADRTKHRSSLGGELKWSRGINL